jgi:hypothetical protein
VIKAYLFTWRLSIENIINNGMAKVRIRLENGYEMDPYKTPKLAYKYEKMERAVHSQNFSTENGRFEQRTEPYRKLGPVPDFVRERTQDARLRTFYSICSHLWPGSCLYSSGMDFALHSYPELVYSDEVSMSE